MQFTRDKATFSQSGFNFYIGDIDDENTILFKEDFIVIGNVKTLKNIFAMGELIILGNIDSKSIYVSKDFFCRGSINTESIEVDGNSKILSSEELKIEGQVQLIEDILASYGKEDDIESKDTIDNISKKDKINKYEVENIDISKKEIITDTQICIEESVVKQINDIENDMDNKIDDNNSKKLIYERYINKKGDIVSGKILRIENGRFILKLDNIEAELVRSNKTKFKIGDNINAYIKVVDYKEDKLRVLLEANDRSYIIKIIKQEMEKNKYDFDKIYIKQVSKEMDDVYNVEIYSEQHTQETLEIIENKVKKYLNGRDIRLNIYNEIPKKLNNCINEYSENINGINDSINRKINDESRSVSGFYEGDTIYHKKFGKGILISIIDTNIINVDFNGNKKDLSPAILLKKNLISRTNTYNIDEKEEYKKVDDKINNNNLIKTQKQLLEKYEEKKFTLIEGMVELSTESYTKININNEVIGILRKENDHSPQNIYNIGEKVICCICSVYIKDNEIKIQIYRNTSNYFKLLFDKYKEELDLKRCNLKMCKYIQGLGAILIVEKKYGFDQVEVLSYINQLMNNNSAINIVKIIEFKYDPYILLSNLFDIPKSSIYLKERTYYLDNILKEKIDAVKELIEELVKIVGYKVKIYNQ